jgi:glyoxylase-like metal-dependent hydrolase (beta-lactamase superfamily II)
MKGFITVKEGIYCVGGSNLSHPNDGAVYLVDFGKDLVMIDSGTSKGFKKIIANILSTGLDPSRIRDLFLTHCHIDHIGSAHIFRERFSLRIVAHEFDSEPIERGDQVMTGASWYGESLPPTPVDYRLKGQREIFSYDEGELVCIHTPGHTPGSISIYLEKEGDKILFGQDIHGPFLESFGSDIDKWAISMKILLDLNCDILCEGHFGIYQPASKVREYIEGYLRYYGKL